MSVVLSNVRAAGGVPVMNQNEPGPRRIDVDELLSRGATQTVACDAGITHADGCLRYMLSMETSAEANGWEARPDPWGRLSQFTGEVLMLHLCPPCAAAARPEGGGDGAAGE